MQRSDACSFQKRLLRAKLVHETSVPRFKKNRRNLTSGGLTMTLKSVFCIHFRFRLGVRSHRSPCGRFPGAGAAELQGISRLRARQPAHGKSVRAYRHMGGPIFVNLDGEFLQAACRATMD